MKSYGQLWEKIVSEGNLREAWRSFRRHHSTKPPVRRYEQNLDDHLSETRRLLLEGIWQPGEYNQFVVFEPKPRVISCCPVKDRVVHHAFCNVCSPLMERRFIEQSYACRKGKGSHQALRRVRTLARRHAYFLKIDIRHYFESIDHDILLGILRGMFREREVIRLLETIVRKPIPNIAPTGRGLPIGNLTSQWFANLYLDGLDHYAVEALGLGRRYLRYMDDMLVFVDSKEEAWRLYGDLRAWLDNNRKLELKEAATLVSPVSEGVPYLGFRVWSGYWRMSHRRLRRTQRSLKRHYYTYAGGLCDGQKLQNVVRAMEGTARWFGFRSIYARTEARYFDGDCDTARVTVHGRLRKILRTRQHHRNLGRITHAVSKDFIEATGAGRRFSSGSNWTKRGGSWNNNATNARLSCRNNNNNNGNANTNNGFRLASTCGSHGGGITQTEDRLHKSHPGQPVLGAAETKMPTGATGPVSAAKAAANVLCLALPTAGARAVLRDGGNSVFTIGHKSFHGHKSFQHNTKGNNA
ncbi:MAG: group II intron reverse transcriptase domain-containing protein [Kiritimatiellae bacterium]|nr:group II intron reverse transcriptase domain-containing protein [Kiritimatiellia bacterium]MBQ8126765.1 group II intron reverse transcriptase domain-containing protein [Kiritimatiellia bacterium]